MVRSTAYSKTGSTQFCWICGRAVDLKTCKTDEHGNAVHELCYEAKINLSKAPKQIGRFA